MNTSSLNKISPTRKECEELIKHILNQEIHQRSTNCHFRHSVDFLPFFESLYPSSVGLAKQVQRAVRSLNLPKDSNGYYIINRSCKELTLEAHLICFFQYEKMTLAQCSHPDNSKFFRGKMDPVALEYCKERLTEYFQYSIPDCSVWIENSELCIYSSSIHKIENLLFRIGIYTYPAE